MSHSRLTPDQRVPAGSGAGLPEACSEASVERRFSSLRDPFTTQPPDRLRDQAGAYHHRRRKVATTHFPPESPRGPHALSVKTRFC